MTLPAAAPVRRGRGSRLTDRRVGLPILALIGFSTCLVVLLCVVAVVRIGALDDGRRDIYANSVVAFSDLDAIQASYEVVRQGYTAYDLADTDTRRALEGQLAAARAGLGEQIEAYAAGTEHADRFSTLADDIAAYLALTDRRLASGVDAGGSAAVGDDATGPLVDVQKAVAKDFTGLRAVLREEADVQARAGADAASSATRLLWVILGASVVLGLALGLLVVRQARTSRTVARPGEPLAGSAQEDLRDVLESVATSADALAASSHQLSAASERIASSVGRTDLLFSVVANEVEEITGAPARALT
jgi:methyl-accepting chemotaxis protein